MKLTSLRIKGRRKQNVREKNGVERRFRYVLYHLISVAQFRVGKKNFINEICQNHGFVLELVAPGHRTSSRRVRTEVCGLAEDSRGHEQQDAGADFSATWPMLFVNPWCHSVAFLGG